MKTKSWQYFKISDYFSVEAGKYYYQDEYTNGSTPYCSASATNNGISKWINLPPDFEGNKIVTGKVGCTAFYQPDPFCATSDCNVLTPKFDMNEKIALFLVTIINKDQNYRWNYGRQCRVNNMKKMKIFLPATNENTPDWDYINSFMKDLENTQLNQICSYFNCLQNNNH